MGASDNVVRNRVFTDLAMASTNVVVGKALYVKGKARASFQMKWSGAAVGTFTFRVSNQADACSSDGTVLDANKFSALVSPTAFGAQQPNNNANAAAPSLAVGVFTFADLCHDWLLPVYTNTSSTGTGQGYGEADV